MIKKGRQYKKLTDAQVQETRELYSKEGITQAALATLFKVTVATICYTINKRWRTNLH